MSNYGSLAARLDRLVDEMPDLPCESCSLGLADLLESQGVDLDSAEVRMVTHVGDECNPTAIARTAARVIAEHHGLANLAEFCGVADFDLDRWLTTRSAATPAEEILS